MLILVKLDFISVLKRKIEQELGHLRTERVTQLARERMQCSTSFFIFQFN